MYNLSIRERKLLAILAGLLAFVFWYKTFFGFLLPSYHQIRQQREQTITLEQELSSLYAEIMEKEKQIAQIQSEVQDIKYQFTSHVGFLLYDIGKLAKGKVTILGIDTQEISNGGYFQIKSIAIGLEGHFQAIIDFVKELENLSGISLKRVELNGAHEEYSGAVEGSLLVYFYDFYGKEIFPSETGFRYEPYQNSNPFEVNWHDTGEKMEENVAETPEKTESIEDPLFQESDLADPWPLAPYTFPVK